MVRKSRSNGIARTYSRPEHFHLVGEFSGLITIRTNCISSLAAALPKIPINYGNNFEFSIFREPEAILEAVTSLWPQSAKRIGTPPFGGSPSDSKANCMSQNCVARSARKQKPRHHWGEALVSAGNSCSGKPPAANPIRGKASREFCSGSSLFRNLEFSEKVF
jgi:hypothetical protein